MHPPIVNPFATRYVRPGRIPWIGTEEQSLERLEHRFTYELGCRAAIVGPHGTGKSTLLEHLVPRLGGIAYREAHGQADEFYDANSMASLNPKPIVWLTLRRSYRPWSRVRLSQKHWRPEGILVVDGYEQLGRLAQCWTRLATRHSQMGLLATSHRTVHLGTLLQTQCTPAIARSVIEHALQNGGSDGRTVRRQEVLGEALIESLLQEERGNLREVLMRLYDKWSGPLQLKSDPMHRNPSRS